MSKWYPQEAADILIESINAALQTFQKSGVEADVSKPLPPNPPALNVPAHDSDEALFNARVGYYMDGVTKSTDFAATLEDRKAKVNEWWAHPNLVGIEDNLKEYGILIGEIKAAEGGLSVGGHPVAPAYYQPPATLQAWVEDALKPHDGGPGIPA